MLARWNEFDRMFGAMDLFRNGLDRMFHDFEQTCAYSPSRLVADNYPRTNLHDTGEALEITAELPGVDKEDLKVNIQGNYLQISGARKQDAPEGFTTRRNERETVSFSRSFTLPYEVESAKVEAALKDGILTMSLPKSDAAKPKQITIH